MAESAESGGTTLSASSKTPEFIAKSFIAGGVAACCAKTSIAPLDRIKILLQAHSVHYKHLGVFSALRAVNHKEGFMALYKGNGAMMIRIFPYGAIQFMSYEQYKRLTKQWLGSHNQIAKLMSGSLAGITAVTFTYPLDMVRARLAFQITGEHIYNGIFHTFQSIFHQEGGIKAFYRGFTPTIIGMVPYAGLSFYTYETLKAFFLTNFTEWTCKPSIKHKEELVLRLPVTFLIGGMAGAMAQTVSYPLDVARRRMQLAMILPDSHMFRNWFQTLLTVYKSDGIVHGLYRGLSINYLRAIPQIAVSFTVYEFMKQMLDLQTGVDTVL
ncbi:solute carrier family 25 member 16-like [Saccoglossus kowalevskii]|uniref:Graves disease carrier protein-like n=1 Tax=Saccoglossus kowalevskii TaxID=10224 RepID=A0ABM0MKL7_SACKO|nr:PREDICTED: graves disease carrier protein-like [Saccoglossus kowalevskii]